MNILEVLQKLKDAQAAVNNLKEALDKLLDGLEGDTLKAAGAVVPPSQEKQPNPSELPSVSGEHSA